MAKILRTHPRVNEASLMGERGGDRGTCADVPAAAVAIVVAGAKVAAAAAVGAAAAAVAAVVNQFLNPLKYFKNYRSVTAGIPSCD